MEIENSPAWSIRGRLRSHDLSDRSAPGPGTYEVPGAFSKTTYSVARANRFAQGKQGSPGPGAYDPQPMATRAGHATNRAKKALRFPSSEAPAPGAYESQSSLKGHSFSIQGKAPEPRAHPHPGPAEYQVSLRGDGPNYKFEKSSRPGMKVSDAPGPGTYNISGSPVAKVSLFGSGQRLGKVDGSQHPGPGSYTQRDIPDTPRFTMRPRLTSNKKAAEAPGPGTYEPSSVRNMRSFSLARADRFGSASLKNPGPGSYSPSNSHLATCKQVSLGSSKKIERPNTNPAPGAYQVKGTNEGRAFTMNGRYSNQDANRAPGPGTYNARRATKHDGNTVFSKEERAARVSDNVRHGMPGPGFYNPKNGPGISYGFGTGRRYSATANSGPGPAEYKIRSTIGNKHYTKE